MELKRSSVVVFGDVRRGDRRNEGSECGERIRVKGL